MSKGSLFFGNASGKLGQVVLSTVKGQQIARAWQPKVANPKTSQQQLQRAKFANSVKFFKRAQQNLFKFAFEDKRKNESDYNAFMRHNVLSSAVLDRGVYDNLNYPALADNWLLSYGSLGEINADNEEASKEVVQLLETPLGEGEIANLTIASASQALVRDYKAINGDYVTLVGVYSMTKTLTNVPNNVPEWHIVQFQIDTTNTGKLLDNLKKQDKEAADFFGKDGTPQANVIFSVSNDAGCAWLGIILSRVTANGVKVSTSYLMPNYYAYEIYKNSLEFGYRQSALNSWGRSSEPILKGGIAKSTNV